MRLFAISLMGLLGLSVQCMQPKASQKGSQESLPLTQVVPAQAWEKVFKDRQTEGCFVLQKVGTSTRKTWNIPRSEYPYPPASTFKIPNSLFALQAGAIPDAETVLPWDSVVRQIPAWNRDHTLRTAIKHSVVWYYQEMARRIGEKRMQAYLDTLAYGNQDISDGIDLFWLEGSLKISAQEQIDFLAALQQAQVPFDQAHIATVHDIMIREQGEDYTLRAKTGWALRNEMNIGWIVGWVDRADETYLFAMNMDMADDKLVSERWKIAREILQQEGIVPLAP